MTGVDPKLSPDASPKIMAVKSKRALRIGNRPIYLVSIVFAIIALTLGMVMVDRNNKAKADIAVTTKKSADAFAKEITAMAEAGWVNPSVPASQPASISLNLEATAIPVLEVPKEPAASETPKLTEAKPPVDSRMAEEIRRMRERRWRQMEAAIDGPIKVELGDMKSGQRNVAAELAAVERKLASLSSSNSQNYTERLAAIQAEADSGIGGSDFSQRGDLSRMNQFSNEGKNWQNPASVESPTTIHTIRTGSVIPATLISGINSDLPGQIVGQVALDVYDSPTGKHLLIPQGSRLVGEYSSEVQYGQSRVFVVWQRLVFPDGKALDLGAMPGSSGAGYSGFRDRVNNHYLRIFGSAVMMSAIVAGVELSQDESSSTSDKTRMSDALSEALGQQLGGVMAEMLRKNMSIAPTLEIRPGYRFNVMLVKDLVFSDPYSGFDYARR